MSYVHRLQSNRFEFKYMINEAYARRIREIAQRHLVPDEYADPNKNNSYEIHSVYLDSPGYALAQATLNGLKNRFKLRLRFYDDRPESPVFFEIKRRLNDVICKERTGVKRDRVLPLLKRRFPDRDDLLKFSPKAFDSLRHFCALRDAIGADQGILVSYSREAYVSPHDNSVRLTFDRGLSSGRFDPGLRINRLEDRYQPHLPHVILEMKFTDRFPNWMQDIVYTFNLQRSPMAKYVACAVSLDSLTTGLLAAG